MLVVVAYDVPCDRRRYRLAKLLSGYGERVQYSVFEAHLDAQGLATLRGKVRKLIAPAEDSVRFYRLGETYENRIIVEGVGAVTANPSFLIH